jgi:phosphoribosyl-dephospho-CoA transferase
MRPATVCSARTHDLLEIDAQQFCLVQESLPRWVEEELRRTPFVVVRRGVEVDAGIPVGIRGATRIERWAAFCDPKLAKRVITPPQLLGRTVPAFRVDAVPAFRSLRILEDRWSAIPYPWGPGGSVGFELATGSQVARPASDLDVVIYINSRMTTGEATDLCNSASDLPTAVDLRCETPSCGFSLKEYADRAPEHILLRTATGVVLGVDPWLKLGGELGASRG